MRIRATFEWRKETVTVITELSLLGDVIANLIKSKNGMIPTNIRIVT